MQAATEWEQRAANAAGAGDGEGDSEPSIEDTIFRDSSKEG